MSDITEGKFKFQFPAGWPAVKYDGEPAAPPPRNYYLRHLESINGLKAVDIVAACDAPTRRLVLLEVKDFREDDADLQHKIEAEQFPLEVVQKALHTLSGLYLSSRAGDPDLAAFGRWLHDPVTELEAVLFLAQPPVRRGPSERGHKYALNTREKQRQGIERRLRSALRPLGFRCWLLDASSVPAQAGWRVVEL